MIFEISSAQIQGAREEQEDRISTRYADNGDLIALVADGLGGHAYGSWASEAAICSAGSTLFHGLTRPMSGLEDLADQMLREAHDSVKFWTPNGEPKPASTLVGGVFVDRMEQACLFAVGDSHVILMRDNEPKHLASRDIAYTVGSNLGKPWIEMIGLQRGDVFLFASDGVDDHFRAVYEGMKQSTARAGVEAIVRAVLEARHPAQDNTSLVMVHVS